MTLDTAQRKAEEVAIQLCEKWFEAGARASWCPAMANDFAQALQQARREALEDVRGRFGMLKKYLANGRVKEAQELIDNTMHALDRLREGR